MAYTIQQKTRALDHYFNVSKNVDKTIEVIGYPERSTLWLWVKSDDRYSDLGSTNRLKYPLELRVKAVDMMLNQHKNGLEVSRELGVDNPVSVYLWRKAYLEGGIDALTPKGRRKRSSKVGGKPAVAPEVIDELMAKNEEMKLEIDLLKNAIEILQEKSGIKVSEIDVITRSKTQ